MYVTCNGTKSVEIHKASVHFLRRSEQDRAIAMPDGAKFASTKINVQACSCKESFQRAKTVNKVVPASTEVAYRGKKLDAENPDVIRSKNETEVLGHENSRTNSSPSS